MRSFPHGSDYTALWDSRGAMKLKLWVRQSGGRATINLLERKIGIKVIRPFPPATLLDPENWRNLFVPALDVRPWVDATIFNDASPLYNADHAHLVNASISFLWAGIPNKRQTKRVVGQCEEVTFRCGAWQKGRQEQQM